MAQKQRGAVRNAQFSWVVALLTLVAVSIIIVLAVLSIKITPSPTDAEATPTLQYIYELLHKPLGEDDIGVDSALSVAFNNHQITINRYFTLLTTIIGILFITIILLLMLLGFQMFSWQKDRRKLEQWRETGFMCERLEFLPANRLKLNNIELDLNKTQIENLKKLANQRKAGKPLHSLDIGDHGVQAVKRLREELGSKFIEKSLIKVRKREGYWLEVDAHNIHALPDK